MNQSIRFCTAADGVRLAYAISGEGPPLVMSATWLTHLEHQWRSLAWRPGSTHSRASTRCCATTAVQAISQKSCGVLHSMGPAIQWVQSYVTDDKVYCVYVAPDEAMVRSHADKGGFPADAVARVRSVIDPTTAE